MITAFFPSSPVLEQRGIPAEPLRWKRVLDIAFIVVAAPLLAPVALVLAALIKIVSPGPLLFRQARVGYLGKHFTCLKFRTMRTDADQAVHRAHMEQLAASGTSMKKLDGANDQRLIPFGKVIRALGLDELPQLINVLYGEMSIVGPRPCIPYELDGYQIWMFERFATPPGLTGLWQVSGKNKTTFREMMKLDSRYAQNPSVLGDLVIMVKTFPALLVQLWETVQVRRQASTDTATAKQPTVPIVA